MSKTVYRRKTLEPELGYVGTQNFLMHQAKRASESLSVKRIVRVFYGEGKQRVIDEVVIVS